MGVKWYCASPETTRLFKSQEPTGTSSSSSWGAGTSSSLVHQDQFSPTFSVHRYHPQSWNDEEPSDLIRCSCWWAQVPAPSSRPPQRGHSSQGYVSGRMLNASV